MPDFGPNCVKRNDAAKRFELVEHGLTAFADYHPHGDVLVIPHVESPVPLRGKGTAARLMEGVAAIAREEGLKLAPTCSYAVAWFRRHPQWRDVLA
ncbi:MAG TPA: GNAT family N-acetyltransferase [Caulobacteraceae bacterium]|nr:GNAT family N-acetyltransferase [Caulobacteraceae bacterium]